MPGFLKDAGLFYCQPEKVILQRWHQATHHEPKTAYTFYRESDFWS